MAKGTNTRRYRNVANIVWSQPMHMKQVPGERKNSFLLLFLTNAGHSCTKAGTSQHPGLLLLPQQLGQPSPCMVSSPRSKHVWAEIAQTGARQESSRAAPTGSKPGSASIPQAAASRRVMLEICSATASPRIWMKMQILMQAPRYILPSVITAQVSRLR